MSLRVPPGPTPYNALPGWGSLELKIIFPHPSEWVVRFLQKVPKHQNRQMKNDRYKMTDAQQQIHNDRYKLTDAIDKIVN